MTPTELEYMAKLAEAMNKAAEMLPHHSPDFIGLQKSDKGDFALNNVNKDSIVIVFQNRPPPPPKPPPPITPDPWYIVLKNRISTLIYGDKNNIVKLRAVE